MKGMPKKFSKNFLVQNRNTFILHVAYKLSLTSVLCSLAETASHPWTLVGLWSDSDGRAMTTLPFGFFLLFRCFLLVVWGKSAIFATGKVDINRFMISYYGQS